MLPAFPCSFAGGALGSLELNWTVLEFRACSNMQSDALRYTHRPTLHVGDTAAPCGNTHER